MGHQFTINKLKQRNIIAEFCGWTLEQSNIKDGICWHLNGIQSEEAPFDYPNDLNGMYEAIFKLSNIEKINFSDTLRTVVSRFHAGWETLSPVIKNYYVENANSQQRAEAFIKTIEKWED